MRKLIIGLAAVVVLVGVAEVQAASVIFTDIGGSSAAFDAAASGAGIVPTVDDYEDLAPGLVDYGQNLARTGYSIATASNDGGRSLRSVSSEPLIEGARSMILYNGTDPMTFSFDSPINAFGITCADLDLGFGGDFVFSIDGGSSQTLLGPGAGDDLRYFFGVIDQSTPFSTITLDRTAGDGYRFDLVKFGVPVPEPSTLILLATGAFGLLACGRRRRR